MWYSAIGYLVTVILGLIISLLTGPEDPHNLNEDLISPPISNFLGKLPNGLKDILNIPLKIKRNGESAIPKGVVNVALDISSEKFTKSLHVEAKFSGKVRKISLPI